MSSTASSLTLGVDVLPQEQDELHLVGHKVSAPLVIVPWLSIVKAKKLPELDFELGKMKLRGASTILKWEWEINSVNDLVSRYFDRVFCTSTGRHIPMQHYAYPDFVKESVYTASSKIYDFCLVGWNNNRVREAIFKHYSHLPSVISRDGYFYHKLFRNKEYDTQFTDILAQSRFSICPEGKRPGTRRFWESLKAGAIPLLISEQMRLPSCWNWENSIIRLKTSRVTSNPQTIESSIVLPAGKEEELRRNCLKAHEFFQKPENLVDYINSQT